MLNKYHYDNYQKLPNINLLSAFSEIVKSTSGKLAPNGPRRTELPCHMSVTSNICIFPDAESTGG